MILRSRILILCFIFSSSIYAQHLKVEYKAIFSGLKQNSTTDISKYEQIILDRVQNKMKYTVESQKITVFTKSNNSFFLILESQMPIERQFDTSLGISLLKLHSYLYGDENVTYGYDKGADFIVKYENRFVEWKITSDTKEILGFTCYKAIPNYTQNYEQRELNSYPNEVWFAPSINKRGGPIKYSNLPGLILEVKSQSVTTTAISVKEINKDKEVPKIDKKIITELQAYKITMATGAALEERMKQ